jgi:hypothetical protein
MITKILAPQASVTSMQKTLWHMKMLGFAIRKICVDYFMKPDTLPIILMVFASLLIHPAGGFAAF